MNVVMAVVWWLIAFVAVAMTMGGYENGRWFRHDPDAKLLWIAAATATILRIAEIVWRRISTTTTSIRQHSAVQSEEQVKLRDGDIDVSEGAPDKTISFCLGSSADADEGVVSPTSVLRSNTSSNASHTEPAASHVPDWIPFGTMWKIALAALCVALFGYQLFLAEGLDTVWASLASQLFTAAVIVCVAFEAIFLGHRYKSFRMSPHDVTGQAARFTFIYVTMFCGALIGNSCRAREFTVELDAYLSSDETYEECVFDEVEMEFVPLTGNGTTNP